METLSIHIDAKDKEIFEELFFSLSRHLKEISQCKCGYHKDGWDIKLKIRSENLMEMLLVIDDDTEIEEITLNGRKMPIEECIDMTNVYVT